jgi:hypothetical protein
VQRLYYSLFCFLVWDYSRGLNRLSLADLINLT